MSRFRNLESVPSPSTAYIVQLWKATSLSEYGIVPKELSCEQLNHVLNIIRHNHPITREDLIGAYLGAISTREELEVVTVNGIMIFARKQPIQHNDVEQQHESDGGSTPQYYDLPKGVTDIYGIIRALNMPWFQANIFKASYRIGKKKGTSKRYDLKKIIYHAQRELDEMEDDE